MTYILPVLYVIVSYTFFLLAVHFGNAITLQIVSILLPFIMGIVNSVSYTHLTLPTICSV